MKILFTGGGTLGSVMPLIAIHQKLIHICRDEAVPRLYNELWLGTRNGPEKEIVEKEGIKFKTITAGKLRRYFDLRNITDIFKIIIGFWQAFFIILKFKPDIILSAGAFVSVPVIWAGWLLDTPSIIHQQDVKVGLANKLMAPFAKKITVALEVSLKDYPAHKTALVGNPVRLTFMTQHDSAGSMLQPGAKMRISQQLGSKQPARTTDAFSQTREFETNEKQNFDLNENLPVLLIIGGGTGAQKVNELTWQMLSELTKFCQIIHLAGRNKNYKLRITDYGLRYQSFEFLADKISPAMQAADLVISRAGMSALTELAYFKKPTIVIPIPHSHQEANARYFAKCNACVYLKQEDLTAEKLLTEIKNLLNNEVRKKELGENMHRIFTNYTGENIIREILRCSA